MGRLLTVGLLALLLCGCTERAPRGATSAPSNGKAKPLIVCTIKPLELIVREVVGDTMEVRTLLPTGADAHDYEPTPGDIEAVSKAALFVRVGGHLDGWAEGLPAARTVAVLDSLPQNHWPPGYEPRPGHSNFLRADLRRQTDDPHFWLAPLLALDAAAALADQLAQLQPPTAAQVEQRKADLLPRITALDQWAAGLLGPHRGKSVVQSHDSLGYLLDGHEIKSVGVIEAHSGVEPSAKRMTELIAAAKEHKAKCVIVDAGHSDKAAQVIAQECGIPVVYMDPEAVSTTQSYASYEAWFIYNVNQLARGLK